MRVTNKKTAQSLFPKLIFLSVFALLGSVDANLANVDIVAKNVEKAQELLVSSKRMEAIQLLLDTKEKWTVNLRDQTKIMQALDQASRVFLSDKAQQLFEAAQSMKKSDPALARERLREALMIEENNIEVLMTLARLEYRENRCGEAAGLVKNINAINRYFDDAHLLDAQIALCLKENARYQEIRSKIKQDSIYWKVADVEASWKNGDLLRATALVRQLAPDAKMLPEIKYWLWKIEESPSKQKDEAARKYVAECNNLPLRMERKLEKEPLLCSRIKEVSDYLEGKADVRGNL